MDKSAKNKIYTFVFLLLLIIGLVFIYKTFVNNDLDKKLENKTTVSNESIDVDNLLKEGKFKEIIDKYEKKGTGSLDRDEKIKLLDSYLGYGNYFYKEAEYSKKSMDILDTMEDEFITLYYAGYAKEIIKDYTGSLNYYNKGLALGELHPNHKSILLNQVGHLYDLQGDYDKVFAYYDEAYKLDTTNESVLANLGRYYVREGDFKEAYNYYNKVLETTKNLPLKSEVNLSLSSVELEINGLSPDLDKSIQYAKQSIEDYPSYPMGYVALARGLYMKNDPSNNEEIERNLDKSIELNPNGYYSYFIYALHEFDKQDKEKTKEYLMKSIGKVPTDMILMDSEREKIKAGLFFEAMMIGTMNGNPTNPEVIVDFIEKHKGTTSSRIAFQLKRNNFGVFSFLKDNKRFIKIVNNFNK